MIEVELDINDSRVIACAERVVGNGLDRLEHEWSRYLNGRPVAKSRKDSVGTRLKELIGIKPRSPQTLSVWANGHVLLYVRELEELAEMIGCDLHDIRILRAVEHELYMMTGIGDGEEWDLTPVVAYLPEATNAVGVGTEPGLILVDMLYKQ
jgi:hypothetical protein